MSVQIGEVIAVTGVQVTLRIFEDSNKETLFYEGERYKGISILEYIQIRRGFRDIVCIVEGEYLDEKKYEHRGNRIEYIRKVDVRPIGFFENEVFFEGIKFLPMIRDAAFLVENSKVPQIYGGDKNDQFVIGFTLKENVAISLPWKDLFNTHIGIFGNTGSGKSNTLANLYSTLFENMSRQIRRVSEFVIIDFNGEYTGDQLAENKKVIKLNTQTGDKENSRYPISSVDFWNIETLSILFRATTNTQRPFLNRVIEGRRRYGDSSDNSDGIAGYIRSTFEKAFCAAIQRPDVLNLLRKIASDFNLVKLADELDKVSWHSKAQTFMIKESNTYFDEDGESYRNSELSHIVKQIDVGKVTAFQELLVRVDLQLVRELIYGYVQFDHIQPLIKRAETILLELEKVARVVKPTRRIRRNATLTVVSFRQCSQDIKKIMPVLIARHIYGRHKDEASNPPSKTMHLIIDEAHNILSQQSSSEHESWKDYRLELFEEIIKEGRKFGVFLTLASQRPADISPTIVSQVHNFFIHRLVNERDLKLIDNSISSLDALSRSLIPKLAKGSCVLTGTTFDLPILLQMNHLDHHKRPDSEDVDLARLWGSEWE